MSDDALLEFAWPREQLGDAICALAQRTYPSHDALDLPNPEPWVFDSSAEQILRWVDAAVSGSGLHLEPVASTYGELASFLRRAAPSIIALPDEGSTQGYLILIGASRRHIALLTPRLDVRELSLETLRRELVLPYQSRLEPVIDKLVAGVDIPPARRATVRAAMTAERLSGVQIVSGWLLDRAPSGSFARQLADASIVGDILTLLGAHAAEYGLLLAAWWVIGVAAFSGRFSVGWFWAWALLLLCMIPSRMLAGWTSGQLALKAATLLKRRLLHGALRLDPQHTRASGSGGLLSRVLEAAAVEDMALSGGTTVAVSFVEIAMVIAVLAAGAGARLSALLFVAWLGVTGLFAQGYLRNRTRWAAARRSMTRDLVERILGHRTRLVQERRARWHDDEDRAFVRYYDESVRYDRSATWLLAAARGYLLVGVAELAIGFALGRGDPPRLAIGIGGVLFGYRVLGRLGFGLASLANALASWREVEPLMQAAAAPGERYRLHRPEPQGERDADRSVVEARGLRACYRTEGRLVLDHCDLTIPRGSRILLEGPSGVGKSTLARVLAGLKPTSSGLLLLEGFDRHGLGQEGWRSRVVLSPQFHENYVFSGSLAFNLLMGRAWPPSPNDLAEARAVCEELGLGELLASMPGGVEQPVGETGWQLSHGERSRVFIARALLQEPRLLILDESFGALDPHTLRGALRCVEKRADTLLVIAQP